MCYLNIWYSRSKSDARDRTIDAEIISDAPKLLRSYPWTTIFDFNVQAVFRNSNDCSEEIKRFLYEKEETRALQHVHKSHMSFYATRSEHNEIIVS